MSTSNPIEGRAPLTAEQEQHLRNCIRALQESPKPEAFAMRCFIHANGSHCGSPACVLGHYASRPDLQNLFVFEPPSIRVHYRQGSKYVNGGPVEYRDHYFLEHFGLEDEDEADELFGGEGCANAQTPDEAIAYLEGFIEWRKTGEWK